MHSLKRARSAPLQPGQWQQEAARLANEIGGAGLVGLCGRGAGGAR